MPRLGDRRRRAGGAPRIVRAGGASLGPQLAGGHVCCYSMHIPLADLRIGSRAAHSLGSLDTFAFDCCGIFVRQRPARCDFVRCAFIYRDLGKRLASIICHRCHCAADIGDDTDASSSFSAAQALVAAMSWHVRPPKLISGSTPGHAQLPLAVWSAGLIVGASSHVIALDADLPLTPVSPRTSCTTGLDGRRVAAAAQRGAGHQSQAVRARLLTCDP